MVCEFDSRFPHRLKALPKRRAFFVFGVGTAAQGLLARRLPRYIPRASPVQITIVVMFWLFGCVTLCRASRVGHPSGARHCVARGSTAHVFRRLHPWKYVKSHITRLNSCKTTPCSHSPPLSAVGYSPYSISPAPVPRSCRSALPAGTVFCSR